MKYDFLSSIDNNFPSEKAGELFLKYRSFLRIDKNLSFQEFRDKYSPFLFAAYVDGDFTGVLYLDRWEYDGNTPVTAYLSGFASRKNANKITSGILIFIDHIFSEYNIKSIKSSTENLCARLCLRKAGFKKIDDTTYTYIKGDN